MPTYSQILKAAILAPTDQRRGVSILQIVLVIDLNLSSPSDTPARGSPIRKCGLGLDYMQVPLGVYDSVLMVLMCAPSAPNLDILSRIRSGQEPRARIELGTKMGWEVTNLNKSGDGGIHVYFEYVRGTRMYSIVSVQSILIIFQPTRLEEFGGTYNKEAHIPEMEW